MDINIQSPRNDVRVFILNGVQPVLDADKGIMDFNSAAEGIAQFSPLVSALFVKFPRGINTIKAVSVPSDNGTNLDALAIELNAGTSWDIEITEQGALDILEQRLTDGGTVILQKSAKPLSQVTTQDIQGILPRIVPQQVIDHNKDPKNAIVIANNGWNAQTGRLNLVMAKDGCGGCGHGDDSQRATQRVLSANLSRVFTGMTVAYEIEGGAPPPPAQSTFQNIPVNVSPLR